MVTRRKVEFRHRSVQPQFYVIVIIVADGCILRHRIRCEQHELSTAAFSLVQICFQQAQPMIEFSYLCFDDLSSRAVTLP
ncbi:hypothetical protein D3C76_1242250 [compost metagenome]